MNNKNILVTGASGFIGSHLCVALIEAGYNPIGVDNLSNSKAGVLEKIEQITKKKITFIQADLATPQALKECFAAQPITAVIHLAAFKAVGESTEQPLRYHSNNVIGLLNLLNSMNEFGCNKFVYSSSATVYGIPQRLPLDEEHPLASTNPYGTTKIIGESILRDVATYSDDYSCISLRYFNPAGAHSSGLLGEDIVEKPANLFPVMCRAHLTPEYQMTVFGDDYDTKDGTCIRDIIHINDLIDGHILALEKCLGENTGYQAVNLGCGKGWSVLEIIENFEKELGESINYKIGARRPGDTISSYASTDYAKKYLGWQTKHDLPSICRDTIKYMRASGAR
ncbi:MAG: UDP-glucose 4-epimerase GalE [Candidatus Portiera sp.]|nr:UDP-glucose 4-epimerase GalE [Portiera sp.]